MKRIKAINGYTIYQVTERDAKNTGKTAGDYEIYFSSDIRDFGVAYSYPEFDGIDGLENAISLCSGNYAIAREIAETESTAVTYERVEEIEKMLDNGASVEEIENETETETAGGETFETFLNNCEWFDGELIINGIEGNYSFVWDNDLQFTEYGKQEYKAILESADFEIDDNVIELTADCTEQYADLFLALCAGYTSSKYYDKCITNRTNN